MFDSRNSAQGWPGSGRHSKADPPAWLELFCVFSPLPLALAFAMCAVQTWQHVAQIKEGHAAKQHERVIMVVALPAIYGVMALNGLSQTWLALNLQSSDEHAAEVARQRMETCFHVGDLYEAWVLYQFGKLTVELVRTSLAKLVTSAKTAEQRGVAQGLLAAHVAVEAQMWLGTWMFVVVCVLQAGWACWMITFAASESHAALANTNAQFDAAGVVASMAAIYNVHTVERTFNAYLADYSPFLKFISVKILVSIAFFQRGFFMFLKAFQQTLPSVLGRVLPSMPLLRGIIALSDIQFEAFYDALIMYQVFIIAALHSCAWSSKEKWYGEYDNHTMEPTETLTYGIFSPAPRARQSS
eukprot:CAMPEP_0172889804 /NCGR_PEP_ID=MMETSP1075-20121228/139748_1 /TAXON_ID=2916 /ORGANISM="Ceratium fusus, Strain PA161109" /LENGTH=355 /DNA_ID=CAMNT_0013743941 /DNA_START=154 /DNA_END=1221 /DNA_ORIENTATION=+